MGGTEPGSSPFSGLVLPSPQATRKHPCTLCAPLPSACFPSARLLKGWKVTGPLSVLLGSRLAHRHRRRASPVQSGCVPQPQGSLLWCHYNRCLYFSACRGLITFHLRTQASVHGLLSVSPCTHDPASGLLGLSTAKSLLRAGHRGAGGAGHLRTQVA